MKHPFHVLTAVALMALAGACSDDGSDSPAAPPTGPIATTISASGDITAKVDEYRALLGDPRNGGTVGPQTVGRREINWDGVPAQFDNGDNLFPADFFNTNVKLGAIFASGGSGFRNDSTLFDGVNPAYAQQFSAFSVNKIFAPVGSNVLDMTFRVAGTTTPALVSGLGAVFTDVDTQGATTLDYYAADGRLIGQTTRHRSGATRAGSRSWGSSSIPSRSRGCDSPSARARWVWASTTSARAGRWMSSRSTT